MCVNVCRGPRVIPANGLEPHCLHYGVMLELHQSSKQVLNKAGVEKGLLIGDLHLWLDDILILQCVHV